MGKIGKTLFGGPAKSSQTNTNNDMLTGSLGGALGGASQATSLMSSLLGGDTSGVDAYAKSGGLDFLMDQMQKGVTSSKAASGLLNSGSYGTALQDRAHGLASTYLDQYMNHVNQLGQLGIGAGGVLADSGQQKKETGAKKGIAGTLIKGAAALSDPRLKTDVEKVGEYADGLGRYRWNYVEGMGLPKGRHEGVMADEVKELRPWAYIPNFMGEYAGVDYGRL